MAHIAHPPNHIAPAHADFFDLIQAWAAQKALTCIPIEDTEEDVLDIRLGDRRQIFVVAPRQEGSIYVLAFGVLPATSHRHGCPGRFLGWLQATGDPSLSRAVFVPHVNAYFLSVSIPLDDRSGWEARSLPTIEYMLCHLGRLLVCYEEANGLDDLASSTAQSFRARFQSETVAGRAAVQCSDCQEGAPYTLH